LTDLKPSARRPYIASLDTVKIAANIFDGKSVHCMWMRNTLIPLSVAFLDDEGRIVNIEDMKPQTEDSHCARAPVRYALEMTQGWFAQRGLKPGAVIGGINASAAKK